MAVTNAQASYWETNGCVFLASETTFHPQAQRDTDQPDIGWHAPGMETLAHGSNCLDVLLDQIPQDTVNRLIEARWNIRQQPATAYLERIRFLLGKPELVTSYIENKQIHPD